MKSAHLADALGYDTSYISRWVNDIKLPSLKNNDDLFLKISRTIVGGSDEAAIERSVRLTAPSMPGWRRRWNRR